MGAAIWGQGVTGSRLRYSDGKMEGKVPRHRRSKKGRRFNQGGTQVSQDLKRVQGSPRQGLEFREDIDIEARDLAEEQGDDGIGEGKED